MKKKLLKLGIPKGKLEGATIELFRRAGWRISLSPGSATPGIDDEEISCALVRAQEMARYVERGLLDAGLSGLDWILENQAKVEIVSDLAYSTTTIGKAYWVLAVPEDSHITSLEDCANKRISTELVNFTKRYFEERAIPVEVEFSWGANEAEILQGLVDAIVEATETGATIRPRGMRIIHTLLDSNAKLIANPASLKHDWKRAKIQQIALLLRGALNAENLVGLKMNVPENKLLEVMKILPSITAPTIAQLYKTDWFAVESMVEESVVREIIPRLVHLGAEGIVEYSLNKSVGSLDTID